MMTMNVSAAFTTEIVEETRDFYVQHLDATVVFDAGWYVDLQFGGEMNTLQFMSPQNPSHKLSRADGLIYNFMVDDVDREHERLLTAGFEPVIPLEDHPWGDRGFGIKDPNGITLYLYSKREPTAEYKKFFRQ
jgi:uncharacterized glyoxalase superfamily protein PhnB